tara:strand:- start:110 stop:439 length:330 start_codon:yes stop_codon:yes gene_type:complete
VIERKNKTYLVYIMKLVISNSDRKDKKLKAVFTDKDGKKTTTHFGARGMDDYTLTKDKKQRAQYRRRHKKDLSTKDYKRAGFLSYYILWGDSTSRKVNIDNYKKRFKLS